MGRSGEHLFERTFVRILKVFSLLGFVRKKLLFLFVLCEQSTSHHHITSKFHQNQKSTSPTNQNLQNPQNQQKLPTTPHISLPQNLSKTPHQKLPTSHLQNIPPLKISPPHNIKKKYKTTYLSKTKKLNKFETKLSKSSTSKIYQISKPLHNTQKLPLYPHPSKPKN